MVKNPPANAGNIRDVGSVPGWGRSPGGGHDNPLQYSCLENPKDRGAWWTTGHRVEKSWFGPQGADLGTVSLFLKYPLGKISSTSWL